MNQKFDINKLNVAKPCHMSWENMTGDERVRLCNSCDMNIYNISEMTSAEITTLIETREGRLCGRIVKRADGTVMTKDCPPGIRGYRKRISRFAGAAFATILGLVSFGYGQNETNKTAENKTPKAQKTKVDPKDISIKGVVTDPAGAIIPNATVTVRSIDGKFYRTTTTANKGEYFFAKLPEGKYEVEIAAVYFKKQVIKNVTITKNKVLEIDVSLDVTNEISIVGVIAPFPKIDTSSSSKKSVISGKKLRKLPINQ